MHEQLHELDVVALTVDLPDQKLLRGQVGTIVLELSPDMVEVEFADENGRTYAQLSLPRAQLLRLRYHMEAA